MTHLQIKKNCFGLFQVTFGKRHLLTMASIKAQGFLNSSRLLKMWLASLFYNCAAASDQ